MEENNRKDEKNIFNSIGSNEEITEPHVKQIISAFGGKKFAREDIDKFKQLETSFRNIAKLKDGEDILKNLTTDIKETIINSARYQASDGTISIGQIASVIIARSEEVYKENLVRNETIETKSVMAETIKKIDEEKEKNGGKLWVAEHGLKEEEIKKFEGDLFALFRGLGIEMTKDDEKDHSEFSDDMHKRAENPEDVIAREYVEREKEFFEKRDKESGLRYADAMIRALKELIEGKLKLIDNPMLSKELREAAQKELDENDSPISVFASFFVSEHLPASLSSEIDTDTGQ